MGLPAELKVITVANLNCYIIDIQIHDLELNPGFPPIQKQVNHTLPSYSQYDSRLIILWTIKVYGFRFNILWTIYGPVYDTPDSIKEKVYGSSLTILWAIYGLVYDLYDSIS